MKLGEKVKLLRTELEMTQPELATKAGIEQSYLSKLENEKAIPSFDIINRISMALGTTGLKLVDSLSQSFVENHLSHIPEIAAEYAVIRQKREQILKKRFIIASLIVVFGIGLTLLGGSHALFPEKSYNYFSDGVVTTGENILQFHQSRIDEINETKEEYIQRLNNNRSRFDRIYLSRYDSFVSYFIQKVEGGKRLYVLEDITEVKRHENDILLIMGIMLIFSGLFVFLFNIRFKP